MKFSNRMKNKYSNEVLKSREKNEYSKKVLKSYEKNNIQIELSNHMKKINKTQIFNKRPEIIKFI